VADAGLGTSNRGQSSVDHDSCHIRYRQPEEQIVRTLLRRKAPVFESVQLPITIQVLELKAANRYQWDAAMPEHHLTSFSSLPTKERRRRKRKEESDNRKAHSRHNPVPSQKVSTGHLAVGW
jgi:hypothetical protein